MTSLSRTRLRFNPDNFARLIKEAEGVGVGLHTIIYRRTRRLLSHWPDVTYILSEEKNKKRLTIDLSGYERLQTIATDLGYDVAYLGDLIATFKAKP